MQDGNGLEVIKGSTLESPYIYKIENAKLIAQAQAKAIKQGKYAPVLNTAVVQDLKALGSVHGLMQLND